MIKAGEIIENGLCIYWMTCVLFEYEEDKKLRKCTNFYDFSHFERFLQESVIY